ncbi:MAG TPA: tetratricopeptide repeat protein [Terracidiphilus sp.]
MRLSAFLLLFASACIAVPCPGQAPVAPVAGPASPAARSNPPEVAAEVAAAEEAIVKSDWKTAESKLAAYLTAHPDDARALFDAGYAADALNELDQAAAYYQRAVKADPQSFEAQLSLGLLLARQGKMEEARAPLEAATQLDAGEAGATAKARAWRALAQIDRGADPAKASSELLDAIKLTAETPRDTLLAAELAAATNQLDPAEAAYRRVLQSDGKNLEATAGLVHVLIAKKQYADAEAMARKGLEQSPDDPALTAQLATALVAQDKAEAIPLLEKLHQAHPQDENMTRMLAEVTAEAGDAAASDKLYAPLVAAHPDDAELLIAHGQNLIRQMRFAEAFQVFTKATNLAPADADGWSGLAFSASKTRQPSVTINALTMRSKSLPDNPSTLFLWATSYDLLHDRDLAITYYKHFLEAAAGKFPDQEWQARQRLLLLEKKQ